MVPDHIGDLPRRDDDNRQLMLGLIDDLPDGGRGARELMMWGLGLAVAVVLFVVLVWVTAPS